MKRREIEKCIICGKGVMDGGQITFFQISLQRFVVDIGAVRRQHGLEMMIGNPAIAAVMGPDEDLANPVCESPDVGIICERCASHSTFPLALIQELISEEKGENIDESGTRSKGQG